MRKQLFSTLFLSSVPPINYIKRLVSVQFNKLNYVLQLRDWRYFFIPCDFTPERPLKTELDNVSHGAIVRFTTIKRFH